MAKANILVVEDENIVALDIKARLLSLGYQVPAIASSGEQAIHLMALAPVDLVLMDIHLKGEMDGIEAADKIRTQYNNIPIVFLTAYADEATLERARITEPFGYILKPFEERELTTNIEIALYRQKAEKRVKDKEEYYRALIENASDLISIVDKDGIILYLSPSAVHLLGYQPEEQTGKNVTEYIHLEDAPALMEHFAYAIQTQANLKAVRYRFRHKDGSWRVLESVGCNRLSDPVIAGVVFNSRDVTEIVEMETAFRASEQRYELAARGANDGLWDWDLHTNLIYFSPRWKAIIGCQDGELGSTPEDWFSRIHPDDRKRVWLDLVAHRRNQIPYINLEYRMLHQDGTPRWVLTRGMVVLDEKGVAYRMAGSQTDITDRKRMEDQLLFSAFHDALTNLPNRALFLDRVEHALTQAHRYKDYQFAILYLDLDSFKSINDRMGHSVGDEFLIRVAQLINGGIRDVDTAARLGSDEFAILFDGVQKIDSVLQLVKNIQEGLNELPKQDYPKVFLTASVGIVANVEPYDHAEEIIRDAGIAMYQARLKGRSQYSIFRSTMRLRTIARLEDENDLRGALARQELELYYQPIIHLSTKQVIGFEALTRWFHPKRGLILPSVFIPLAEEIGLIISIGAWVIREACRQIKEWQVRFYPYPALSISVNISGKQIIDPQFNEVIENAVHENNLDRGRLHLEFTESELIDSSGDINAKIQKLSDSGIELHIDDFGMGYSSLNYLKSLPINTLKIDRSFVSGLGISDKDTEIVSSTIRLANDMKLGTIAEGIETAEQFQLLQSKNCQYGQGYFIAHPMNAGDTEKWLERLLTIGL